MTARALLNAMGFVKPPKPKFLFKHPVKGAADLVDYTVAKKAAHKRLATTLAAFGAAVVTAVAAPLAWKKFRR